MTRYYCKQKFNWVSVSMSDGKVRSCCKATEDRPSLDQISGKTFGFFNYDKIQQDRRDMLDGKKISSCSHCWDLEDQGLSSRRIKTGSNIPDIIKIDDCVPESLNIVLGEVCAMTCVYCCKEFSRSWRQDLITNGDYNDLITNSPRHRVSMKDKLMIQISQTKLHQTKHYQEILSQIKKSPSQIKQIIITGGEPLLSDNLQQILDIFLGNSVDITIYTGLGIKPPYLLKRLARFDNQQIRFVVSAENTHKFHEFSRYGSSYQEFLKNLDVLKKLGFQYQFACSISNTTIFGLYKFVQWLESIKDSDRSYHVDSIIDPDYLAPNVIDDISKDMILSKIEKITDLANLVSIVQLACSDLQRRNANAFLTEFAKRRNLSLDIFPGNFVSWLQQP